MSYFIFSKEEYRKFLDVKVYDSLRLCYASWRTFYDLYDEESKKEREDELDTYQEFHKKLMKQSSWNIREFSEKIIAVEDNTERSEIIQEYSSFYIVEFLDGLYEAEDRVFTDHYLKSLDLSESEIKAYLTLIKLRE
jgi:hypothetical protein